MKRFFTTTALLLTLGPAASADYTFTNIADGGPGSPFTSFIEGSTVLEDGTVYFRARLAAGGEGYFTGSNLPADTFVDTSGPYSGMLGFIFNATFDANATTRVFAATLDAGGQGLFTGPNPTANAVPGSTNFTSIEGLKLSGNNSLVFYGNNGSQEGLFGGSNLGTSLLVRDPSGGRRNFQNYGIANDGTLVYEATTNAPTGGTTINNYFIRDSIGTAAIASAENTSAGQNSEFLSLGGIDINDNGTIAFVGNRERTTDQTTLYLTDSTLNRTAYFVQPNGNDGLLNPIINNLNVVAFEFDNSIYAGNGPDSIVISEGDTLFGSEIRTLRLLDFNDNGDVLFAYRNTDNIWGLALATSDGFVIPEPGTATGLLLLGCLARRRRGQRPG